MKAVTLSIAGRPYTLRVSQSDVAAMQRLGEEVNQRIHHYHQQYIQHDKQDSLSLTVLEYAAELNKAQQLLKQQHSFALSARLQKINSRLDAMLEK